jgi:hypothetical protein
MIVEQEVDIPWPLSIASHECFVSRRPLILRIACQHTLQTHTHALYIVHRAPALFVEQIEADDAVGVDVRMHGDRVGNVLDEHAFWGFCMNILLVPAQRVEWETSIPIG